MIMTEIGPDEIRAKEIEKRNRYEKAALRRASCRADLVVAEREAKRCREAFDAATKEEDEALRAMTGEAPKVYRGDDSPRVRVV